MRSILILAIFALVFASCHNDVPGLPTAEEIEGYKFCKYTDEAGESQCKSIPYEMTENTCRKVHEINGTKIESFCNKGCLICE